MITSFSSPMVPKPRCILYGFIAAAHKN